MLRFHIWTINVLLSFHTAQKFSNDITNNFPAINWHGERLLIKISMMFLCTMADILYQEFEYLQLVVFLILQVHGTFIIVKSVW